ncbi:MAG: 2OG-Fe(II) oxygenase [Reinekea sp.]
MDENKTNSERYKAETRAPDTQSVQGKANQIWTNVRPSFSPRTEPQLQSDLALGKRLPGGGRWRKHTSPFLHFTANNVCDLDTYNELCHQFSLVQETTHGTRDGKFKMKPAPGNNDGLILGLTDSLAANFAPFFTEKWLRSLAELAALNYLPRVEGALHSNPQGSRTGWIHTDCCSAWFDESQGTEKLMLPPRGRCSYFTGLKKNRDAKPIEYVRAATMIFYLCNDGWQHGDGGETAIYSENEERDSTERKFIPPINNSAFLFECSPYSFHRFITNPGRPRNSIILWLHSTVTDAQDRWGEGINRRGYL